MMTTTPQGDEEDRRPTSEEFRHVIGHFASGVTVVTTVREGVPYGTTANAISSLCLEPPMVVVCMNQQSATGQAIVDSGALAVNILGERDGELAARFAARGGDKFRDTEMRHGRGGQPLLTSALAQLVCRVTRRVTAGTHNVFLAEVEQAEASSGAPLAYFRGQFGRLELSDALNSATPEAVEDAYDARRVIELGVVDQTVGRTTDRQIAQLRWLMAETSRHLSSGGFRDVGAFLQANAGFHEYIVSLTGSEALLSMYRRLGLTDLNTREFATLDGVDSTVLDRDHKRLVTAYATGDVALARAVVNDHADRPRQRHRALAAR